MDEPRTIAPVLFFGMDDFRNDVPTKDFRPTAASHVIAQERAAAEVPKVPTPSPTIAEEKAIHPSAQVSPVVEEKKDQEEVPSDQQKMTTTEPLFENSHPDLQF